MANKIIEEWKNFFKYIEQCKQNFNSEEFLI